MITTPPVPAHYLGVWQRTYLETATETDHSSRVYWLQTSHLHADIRIPADRPDFTDKQSLEDFTADELKLLARQKGFAGITVVAGNSCQWLRHIDYQPRRMGLDIGYMQFSGKRVLETGIAHDYAEIWEQLPDSQGLTHAFRFEESNSEHSPGTPQAGILVVSGDYFIFARDRNSELPPALSLDSLLTKTPPSRQQLLAFLDFEISFGRVTQGTLPWEIQLSTLPFREGKPLFTEAIWTDICHAQGDYLQREYTWNGMLNRRWITNPS